VESSWRRDCSLPNRHAPRCSSKKRARGLADKLGIPVGTDDLAAVHKADIVFVCAQWAHTIPESPPGIGKSANSVLLAYNRLC
jgi:hypothetical protein